MSKPAVDWDSPEVDFIEALADAKLAWQEALGGEDPSDVRWAWCDDDGRPLTWPRDRRHRTVLHMRRVRVSVYLHGRKMR